MKERIAKFLSKNGISQKNILYIIRDDNKTCIHTTEGKVASTYFSIKNIIAVLNDDDLICINKGISLSRSRIASVKHGVYTMSDGRTFKGRVRTPGEHKKNSALITAMNAGGLDAELTPDNLIKQFSVLDKFPLPFAVFELIFDDSGKPIDMIFRYLNSQMAELADSTVAEIHGKSFYHVFNSVDKEWLEINAEVARSGEARTVKRFSIEVGRYLSLYYFSPMSGYSSCMLI